MTGFDAPGMLTVAGDHVVTAEFGMKSTLELSVVGEGSITLDPPQPVGGYCPGTEVTVTAVPDSDWAFSQWGAGLPNLDWSPSQTFRPTPGPTDISAFFVARPGIASLDLVSDLGAWLVALGVYTDPSEVEAYDYDQGASDLVDLETVYLPNGIPDAAEFLSLQVVLQHPGIELKDGRVSHAQVWRIYQTCLAQAQVDLSTQSAAVQRGLAAYMTLGTFPHVGRVLEEVQTHFGVTLDRSLYPNAGDRWFGTDKDMDGDGATNKQEWDYAVSQAAEAKSASQAAVAAYIASVPDPGEEGGAPPSLPDTGSENDFDLNCSNWATVTVLDAPHLTVKARVTTPDGSKVLVLEEGQNANLPLGSEVKVEASDAAWFSSWSAPNSLLDGSDSPSDSFTLTRSTEIWGMVKSTSSFEYPNSVSVSLAGGDEPLVLARGQGQVGNRYIEVREGTLLSVEAPPSPYADTWLTLKLARRDSTHAGRTVAIDPSEVVLVIPSSGGAPHGHGTFSAGASNGMSAVSMLTAVKIDPFVSQVKYAIPYAPGIVWEKTPSSSFVPERSCYVYSIEVPHASNVSPNPVAEIVVRPMNVLTLNPAVCMEGCALDHHGSAYVTPARRYYRGRTAGDPNADSVGLFLHTDLGHSAKGFKVSGGRVIGQSPDEGGLYVESPLLVSMESSAAVTPVFEVGTPELVSVTFNSDHGLMTDEENLFALEGTPYGEPEWTSGESGHSFPISQTKDTVVSLTVKLDQFIPGCFSLVGIGPVDYLCFVGAGGGSEGLVSASAVAPLPELLQRFTSAIQWKLVMTSDLPAPNARDKASLTSVPELKDIGSSGPHEVFVTWGTPIGEKPSIKRMGYLYDHVNGMDHVSEIVAGVARSVNEKTRFGRDATAVPNVSLWRAMDPSEPSNQWTVDCNAASRLAIYFANLLGWPSADRGIITSFPSTDVVSDKNYASDCSDQETCSVLNDAKLYYRLQAPACDDSWYPAENGIRMRQSLPPLSDPNAPHFTQWYYMTVHALTGPFSSTYTDESDQHKDCVFQIMQTQGAVGQWWGRNTLTCNGSPVPANPLPPAAPLNPSPPC